VTSWNQEQLGNAGLIVNIGRAMNMSNSDITIALIAAMQESSLRNLTYGDRDSAGLYQQRPSQGWGTFAQVTNPEYAIRKFYTSLAGVSNRSSMSPAQAAQAVQRSAYPDAYSKWFNDAQSIVSKSTVSADTPANFGLLSSYTTGQPQLDLEPAGITNLQGVADAVPVGLDNPRLPLGLGDIGSEQAYMPTEEVANLLGGSASNATGLRQKMIQEAEKYLGTPYKWGGAAPGAFDCSGLIYYVFNKLGIKVNINGQARSLPRVSQDQVLMGQRADIGSLQPGDFVGFGSDAHHIAIYLGGNQILEAPHTGAQVRIRSLGNNENAFGVHLDLGGF